MNASVSQDQLVLKLSNSLSYIDSDYDPFVPAAAPRQQPKPRGFGRWIADLVAGFATMPRRWATVRELEMMSSRELADIGLTRGDVGRVFDGDFIQEHAARGMARSRAI
jgi:uncharacterized protein YjiS (DUF1127 family)